MLRSPQLYPNQRHLQMSGTPGLTADFTWQVSLFQDPLLSDLILKYTYIYIRYHHGVLKFMFNKSSDCKYCPPNSWVNVKCSHPNSYHKKRNPLQKNFVFLFTDWVCRPAECSVLVSLCSKALPSVILNLSWQHASCSSRPQNTSSGCRHTLDTCLRKVSVPCIHRVFLVFI